MNPRGFLQRAQPYSSKCQFENGSRASAFEPLAKNGIINPKKWELKTEIDEAVTKNINIHTITNEAEKEKTNSNTHITEPANEKLKPESREELNANIESKTKTKNEQIAKTKATPQTTQKFSNHIKFIDYIPTHEIITYRHLFAYGFYVE